MEHIARITRLATTSAIPKNDETPRKIVNATIGHEDYQTRWQAIMLPIAVRTWVTDKTIGQVTVVSDAEGKLCDLVKLKGHHQLGQRKLPCTSRQRGVNCKGSTCGANLTRWLTRSAGSRPKKVSHSVTGSGGHQSVSLQRRRVVTGATLANQTRRGNSNVHLFLVPLTSRSRRGKAHGEVGVHRHAPHVCCLPSTAGQSRMPGERCVVLLMAAL